MIILGLTGSIGMGKSTAATMLKKMGCAVHDSDDVVRTALKPEGKAFEVVALTFPKVWDKKTHTIKKNILSDIIFYDETEKNKLEDILHPIVRESQNKFLQKEIRMGCEFAVLDIPLLFETNAQNSVDYTVVISAPYHVQRHRVLSRTGMNEEKFKAILETQMPDRQKRQYADFVISSAMGMAYTYNCLEKMLKNLRSKT